VNFTGYSAFLIKRGQGREHETLATFDFVTGHLFVSGSGGALLSVKGVKKLKSFLDQLHAAIPDLRKAIESGLTTGQSLFSPANFF
jgi:hypothetical protein